MSELAGPFAIVAVVLVVSGSFKLRDAKPTEAMLRDLGVAPSHLLVVMIGVIEIVVGAGAFLSGARLTALAVALLYAIFAVVTAVLLRRDAAASCGCFGKLSSKPTWLHVVVNAVAACVGLAASIAGVPGLVTLWSEHGVGVVPYVVFVAIGTWLTVALLTALPEALVAARRTLASVPVRTFEVHRGLGDRSRSIQRRRR